MGQVRRADKRRAQSRGLALEQPGLRVKFCRAGVERNAYLGAELYKLVDRLLLGRPHVRSRDDADAPASRLEIRERVAEMPNSRPDDEGANEVDRVGTRQLCT